MNAAMQVEVEVEVDEKIRVAVEPAGIGRRRHPGESAPSQPVLLVGPRAAFDRAGVTAWLEQYSWPSVWAGDVDRAKWLACIQRISMVVVAVGETATVWPLIEAIRPVTNSPLVVLADPPAPAVIALVAAGVDAVISPSGGPDEVFARAVALLRRVEDSWKPGVRYLVTDGLRVDLRSQVCESRGRVLHLSPTEYALLTFLMSHPGQALTTHTIVRKVWEWPAADGRNALRIFVNRLRRKLGDDPHNPSYIESVRGTGYRFVGNVAEIGDSCQAAADGPAIAPLLDALEKLATGLVCCQTVETATEHLLTCLDETGYTDAMAVFRVQGKTMQLVGQRHMPVRWLDEVSAGVPLRHSYASAHSVLSGETVIFADIAGAGKRFPSTARYSTHSEYHARMFIPLFHGDQVWGHIGLVRRARQSFDFTSTSFFRSATATFALALGRINPSTPTPRPTI